MAGGPPEPDPDLRQAAAVLGLQLRVVLRDLPAAGDLAGRLHRPPHLRLRARPALEAARGAAQPVPAARPRVVPQRGGRVDAARPRVPPPCCASGATASSATRRTRSPPSAATCARPATCSSTSSVLVVLVGFAVGSLFGYKGGVIVVVGNGFSNTLTQYDDFAPGSLFDARRDGAVLVRHRLLRRRLADERAGAGAGARLRLAPDLPRDADLVAGAAATTSRSTTR